MNFMIINCHTANRGDEAAVHALVDELLVLYPAATITLGMRGQTRYYCFSIRSFLFSSAFFVVLEYYFR